MTIGVATANSILMVVFANDERETGKDSMEAASNAGFVRLRPVCMTALAMIIGMLPMALALGEGGEQNAPLGRAVIGGLLFATIGTLFIVPVMYSWLRKEPPRTLTKRLTRHITRAKTKGHRVKKESRSRHKDYERRPGTAEIPRRRTPAKDTGRS